MSDTFKDRKDRKRETLAKKLWQWELNAATRKARAKRVKRKAHKMAMQDGLQEALG